MTPNSRPDGQLRPVGENDLSMFSKNLLGNLAVQEVSGMITGSNHEKSDTGQAAHRSAYPESPEVIR